MRQKKWDHKKKLGESEKQRKTGLGPGLTVLKKMFVHLCFFVVVSCLFLLYFFQAGKIKTGLALGYGKCM